MKLGHIVRYHDVFFKFDICHYCTILLVVMALLFMNNNKLKRFSLSKSNIWYQNFMKLDHIDKYHNV